MVKQQHRKSIDREPPKLYQKRHFLETAITFETTASFWSHTTKSISRVRGCCHSPGLKSGDSNSPGRHLVAMAWCTVGIVGCISDSCERAPRMPKAHARSCHEGSTQWRRAPTFARRKHLKPQRKMLLKKILSFGFVVQLTTKRSCFLEGKREGRQLAPLIGANWRTHFTNWRP